MICFMINGFINLYYRNAGNEGFSLIEALVSIVIIGITTTIVFFFIIKFLGSSKSNLRLEAVNLIQHEIQNTIANKALNDTSYSNRRGNLKLKKHIIDFPTYYSINFSVELNNKTRIAEIPLIVKK